MKLRQTPSSRIPSRQYANNASGSRTWTTPRAVLFSAFAASLTCLYASRSNTVQSIQAQAFKTKPQYGTKAEMERAIAELRVDPGEDMISTDDEDLKLHGYSEWSSISIDRLPTAVVYPKSTNDVAKIAKTCSKYKIPMIPYSG